MVINVFVNASADRSGLTQSTKHSVTDGRNDDADLLFYKIENGGALLIQQTTCGMKTETKLFANLMKEEQNS